MTVIVALLLTGHLSRDIDELFLINAIWCFVVIILLQWGVLSRAPLFARPRDKTAPAQMATPSADSELGGGSAGN